MNGKYLSGLVLLIPVLLAGCPAPPPTHLSPQARRSSVVATAAELSLLAALNAKRREAGKGELKTSPTLAALAREESDGAAASGVIPADTTDRLRVRSGLDTVGRMQGILKDRGASTGASFVEYWAKDDAAMILDTWSTAGVGVSRAADGRLFATVVLGSAGGAGSALMRPAMSPSGF